MPELGWFEWVIGGVVASGLAIVAYLNGRITSAVDKGKDNELAITRLQLHVSENYTTKNEVRTIREETMHTLDRLHERLDKIPTREEIEALLDK